MNTRTLLGIALLTITGAAFIPNEASASCKHWLGQIPQARECTMKDHTINKVGRCDLTGHNGRKLKGIAHGYWSGHSTDQWMLVWENGGRTQCETTSTMNQVAALTYHNKVEYVPGLPYAFGPGDFMLKRNGAGKVKAVYLADVDAANGDTPCDLHTNDGLTVTWQDGTSVTFTLRRSAREEDTSCKFPVRGVNVTAGSGSITVTMS